MSSLFMSAADKAEQADTRKRLLEDMGDRLIDHLRPQFPEGWRPWRFVDQDEDDGDFNLNVSFYDEDESRQVYFLAIFDFNRRQVMVDSFNIQFGRGAGIGRAFFTEFKTQALEAGFEKLTLQSTGIGSYFWITQGLKPNFSSALNDKLAQRVEGLSEWVPSHVTSAALTIVKSLPKNPERLREIAALDFRHELKRAFANDRFQTALQNCAPDPYPVRTIPEAYKIAVPANSNRDPLLGQIMLVGTGWSGAMKLRSP